jgi:hypothetical protein
MKKMKRRLFLGGPKHGHVIAMHDSPRIEIPYGKSPVACMLDGEPFEIKRCTVTTITYELHRYVYETGGKDGGPLMISVYKTSDASYALLHLIGSNLALLPVDFRDEPGFWIAYRMHELWDEFVRGIAFIEQMTRTNP